MPLLARQPPFSFPQTRTSVDFARGVHVHVTRRFLSEPLRARGLGGPGGGASQSLAPGRGGPSFSELSFWKVFSRSSPEHSRGTWLPVGPTATERSLRLGGLSKGSVIPRLVQGPRKDRFLSRPLKRFLIGGSVVPPKVEEIMPVAST